MNCRGSEEPWARAWGKERESSGRWRCLQPPALIPYSPPFHRGRLRNARHLGAGCAGRADCRAAARRGEAGWVSRVFRRFDELFSLGTRNCLVLGLGTYVSTSHERSIRSDSNSPWGENLSTAPRSGARQQQQQQPGLATRTALLSTGEEFGSTSK